jgi:hypothetical protein
MSNPKQKTDEEEYKLLPPRTTKTAGTIPHIKFLALFLLLIVLCLWMSRPKFPFKTSGAQIKTQLLAGVPLSLPGIKEITILLDNNRINKVNQRRNPSLINHPKYSEYFGQEKAFRPLLVLNVQGPMNVEIQGDKTIGNIKFHVKAGLQEVEVYPNYNLKELFQGVAGDKEIIKIYESEDGNFKSLVEEIQAQWSGPDDLFLSSKSLIDLASISTNFKEKGLPQELKNIDDPNSKNKPIKNWLEDLGEALRKKQWRYETDMPYAEGDGKGWQRIRDGSRILSDQKANCIDIAILISVLSQNKGFDPFIIANSGHSLCAVSEKTKGISESYKFEGTDYLKSPLKPPSYPTDTPREYLPGEEIVYPQQEAPRAPEAQELYSVNIDYWAKFYRKNKN